MDKLKIILVQETNWLDRNVIHQHHLGERLAQRGHQVVIIDYDILWPTRSERKFFQPRQVFHEVNRHIEGVTLDVIRPAMVQAPLLCHLTWTANSLLELRRLMDDFQPDVVIGLTLTNSYLMAKMLKRRRIPYVSMVLEPYHTMVAQTYLQGIARLAEERALANTDRVAVFTPQMVDYVVRLGMLPERVSLLKTGVSLDAFHPGLDGSLQREALGIPAEAWVLFFMGWLYDFSGLREIVRAASQDRDLLKGATFVIVGDGDIYSELQALIEAGQIADRVILTGRRPYPEIPSLLGMANVCMMPSLDNSTTRDIVPMKVYEYLAAGVPVVAADLPGMRAEFGEDSGILYAGDPLEGIERAIQLRDQPEAVHKLGAAGRRTAEANADWEKTTDHFEQLLFDTVNE